MINPQSYTYTFGKWKGYKYSDVPWNYSWWAHHNLDWFTLPDEEVDRLTLLNRERVKDKNRRRNYAGRRGWVE